MSIGLALFVTCLPNQASAELTSKNHPAIKAILTEAPKADKNKDGVLSYEEYEAFLRSGQQRKSADKKTTLKNVGPLSMVLPNGDLLITDFEESSISRMTRFGWELQGRAFAQNNSHATRLIRRRVGHFQGKYLLSSMTEGDAQVGSIRSPQFKIELPFIEFLISGGRLPQRACLNLIIDNKIVRTATGKNDDRLQYTAFDVKAYKGQLAQIQIVDSNPQVWGHINVDHIVQTKQPRTLKPITEVPVIVPIIWATALTNHQELPSKSEAAVHQGPCTFADNAVHINKKRIALDDLLLAIITGQSNTQTVPPHLITLINGEKWRVNIVGIEKDDIVIQSTLLGNHKIPLSKIASLVFMPSNEQYTADTQGKPGTIYQTESDPIPGKLVWIRSKDIAIDCPLGIIPLPRTSVTHYVVQHINPVNKQTQSLDQINLIDGSSLRGHISQTPTGDLHLSHAEAGEITLDWKSVRRLRRSPINTHWLEYLKITNTTSTGPATSPPASTVVSSDTDTTTATTSARPNHASAFRRIRMAPHTTIQYQIPTGKTNNHTHVFRARVQPVPNSRTSVVARIKVAEKTLWESTITPSHTAKAIAVKLPNTQQFTIELDFAGPIAFPVGIDWLDACVQTLSDKQ